MNNNKKRILFENNIKSNINFDDNKNNNNNNENGFDISKSLYHLNNNDVDDNGDEI